jgi:hypothetical protein
VPHQGYNFIVIDVERLVRYKDLTKVPDKEMKDMYKYYENSNNWPTKNSWSAVLMNNTYSKQDFWAEKRVFSLYDYNFTAKAIYGASPGGYCQSLYL